MRKINCLAIGQSMGKNKSLLFDPETGNSFQMNGSACEMIQLLQSNVNEDQVLKELSERWDIDQAELKLDLFEFISQLKIFGLY
jgi:hypothetical protein